jgi:tetratricopeptide (TPR) repeat protein
VRRLALAALVLAGAASVPARAEEPVMQLLRDSRALYGEGQYFKAARYAFAAGEAAPEGSTLKGDADAQITMSLIRAGLEQSATYFFIRTLQSGNRPAIRRVLTETQTLLVHDGPDLLRRYLVRHTSYEDYDGMNRSAYLYSLGKDSLLAGQEERAVGYLSAVSNQSPLWPFALQLRASAHAIAGQNERAIDDFRACRAQTGRYGDSDQRSESRARRVRMEAMDLEARCQAGEARTLYQMDRFDDADRAYDAIPKQSLVWPDILFEQAWNSFARREYNRTLGKLVSYKSPALSFVFNTEADVLRAQAYLALCLYADANEVINEFNGKYARVGEEVKRFVETNSGSLGSFFEFGKGALRDSLYTSNQMHRMANRFVRGPYFQSLVSAERDVADESRFSRQFGQMGMAGQKGVDPTPGHGFPGFIDQVLAWRLRAIRTLGGAFVKNSLLDHHATLIADFEKMSFIKLEMLKLAKESLMYKNVPRTSDGDRARGSVEPSRRDYQYYWSFNGEFWNDELGDYVFGLESQCAKGASP